MNSKQRIYTQAHTFWLNTLKSIEIGLKFCAFLLFSHWNSNDTFIKTIAEALYQHISISRVNRPCN